MNSTAATGGIKSIKSPSWVSFTAFSLWGGCCQLPLYDGYRSVFGHKSEFVTLEH